MVNDIFYLLDILLNEFCVYNVNINILKKFGIIFVMVYVIKGWGVVFKLVKDNFMLIGVLFNRFYFWKWGIYKFCLFLDMEEIYWEEICCCGGSFNYYIFNCCVMFV